MNLILIESILKYISNSNVIEKYDLIRCYGKIVRSIDYILNYEDKLIFIKYDYYTNFSDEYNKKYIKNINKYLKAVKYITENEKKNYISFYVSNIEFPENNIKLLSKNNIENFVINSTNQDKFGIILLSKIENILNIRNLEQFNNFAFSSILNKTKLFDKLYNIKDLKNLYGSQIDEIDFMLEYNKNLIFIANYYNKYYNIKNLINLINSIRYIIMVMKLKTRNCICFIITNKISCKNLEVDRLLKNYINIIYENKSVENLINEIFYNIKNKNLNFITDLTEYNENKGFLFEKNIYKDLYETHKFSEIYYEKDLIKIYGNKCSGIDFMLKYKNYIILIQCKYRNNIDDNFIEINKFLNSIKYICSKLSNTNIICFWISKVYPHEKYLKYFNNNNINIICKDTKIQDLSKYAVDKIIKYLDNL